MSAAKGKIRPATAGDFDKLYPLLQELNDTRITRDVWQRLFQPQWRGDDFCPGYVIDDGGELVGFIGTLYSRRHCGGEERRFCNLTSWIVRPTHRQQSVMLLLPLLRDKAVILTSLTSSEEAYAVYEKLGFADLEASARVIYRMPSLWHGRYRIYRGSQVTEFLDESELVLYRDHAGLDLEHCVVEREGQRCYLVLEIKRGRAYLHFAGAPEWLRQHISAFKSLLLSTLGVKTMQVDERWLDGVAIFPSRRKVFAQARQFRGVDIEPVDIDGLYSELVVLATPPEA